jgi:hypothetical protein
MARSRKRRRARRTRPSPRTAPTTSNAPSEAERELLALARELAGLGRDALPRALRVLATAYAPDSPLPEAVARAFLGARGDKTRVLALAWAREQVRLALQEVLEATPPSARGMLSSPDTVAWLLLAGAEALAKEPPAAVSDRLKTLAALTGGTVAP